MRPFDLIRQAAFILIVLGCSQAEGASPRPRWYVEGFEPMCARIPAECAHYTDGRMVINLTEENFQRLIEINFAVNKAIIYKTDQEQYGVSDYFTYPTTGKGDCEDYALEKRRRLVRAGFSRRALLLMVVKTSPELHMLLIARTDKGDLALDINTHEIKLVEETGYLINWVQSQKDPRQFDDGKDLHNSQPRERPTP